jgi:hypothetical protein
MSFLDSNNAEFISARLTKKGRNSISIGNFNIKYFQLGDSEYVYDNSYPETQSIMSPLDNDTNVKYPYKMDDSETETTFGTPLQNSTEVTIRNVMGSAGFVSNYLETNTSILCFTERIVISQLDGGKTITVESGNAYRGSEFITIVLDQFIGTDPDIPIVSGQCNSFIYKIININGDNLVLDRNTPDLSTLSGYAQIIINKCEIEYPNVLDDVCLPVPIDTRSYLNPWSLNVVWGDKLIGTDENDEGLTGYTSNKYVSTKEYFGYHSTGQTVINEYGTTVTDPTKYKNSFGELISITPKEQRIISIIHYSEIGDIRTDSERFFKYDDYISCNDVLDDSIYTNEIGYALTDKEYFEVYLPFVFYHRNTGTTIGATFKMGDGDFYVKSKINPSHMLFFKYLVDEQGNKVGRIFPNNKIIVFDDQELSSILDYRSNRRFTLSSPKVGASPSDVTSENSILSGGTGQTAWVTYLISDSDEESSMNSIPCNYFSNVKNVSTPSNIIVKFGPDSFRHMKDNIDGIRNGYVAKRFMILVQITDDEEFPRSDMWKVIDYSEEVGGNPFDYINPQNMTGVTFTITKSKYDSSPFFDLETYMGNQYFGELASTTQPQFGDDQIFPGSIRVVRATDVQKMVFKINLPETQFNISQNPTYVSGNPKITEVTLLDSNKDVLVKGKMTVPITRIGNQILNVKLDF